jgi:putative membrane protein
MKIPSPTLDHFIKTIIFACFTIYIVILFNKDTISYYIAPRMEIYIIGSAFILFGLAVYQLYLAVNSLWHHTPSCDCGHEHSHSDGYLKKTLIYGLFIFPLFLGFMLPDEMMGTSLAAKKGMNLSSASMIIDNTKLNSSQNSEKNNLEPPVPLDTETQKPFTSTSSQQKNNIAEEMNVTDTKLDSMFKSDMFTEIYADFGKKIYLQDIIEVKDEIYIETLTTLDLYKDHFLGKKITITGFVYRQEDFTKNQFVLGRFAVQCCSADASPFGVLVEHPDANLFATDSWMRATGTIEKTIFNEVEILKLNIEQYEQIAEPTSKYVNINYQFGLDD